MGGGRRRPTASRESPKWRKEAAVVFRAPLARGMENREKWMECSLLVLLGNRGKKEQHTQARNAATGRWRPSGARVGVARVGEASGEDARAVLGLGTTRGGDGSRRWRRGGSGAAVSGDDTSDRGAAGEAGGAEHVPEEEEEGRGSEGLF
jgi:hypothetical protein